MKQDKNTLLSLINVLSTTILGKLREIMQKLMDNEITLTTEFLKIDNYICGALEIATFTVASDPYSEYVYLDIYSTLRDVFYTSRNKLRALKEKLEEPKLVTDIALLLAFLDGTLDTLPLTYNVK